MIFLSNNLLINILLKKKNRLNNNRFSSGLACIVFRRKMY